MKAKDLMIGDWVLLYDKPRKVEIIYDYDRVQVDCIEEDCTALSSVPLAPEILGKNGFKYTDNHTLQGSDTYLLRYEQNGFDYTITYKLNDWFAVDSYDDRTYRIFEMETGRWCVHQLQHALKFCGINKEIVL